MASKIDGIYLKIEKEWHVPKSGGYAILFCFVLLGLSQKRRLGLLFHIIRK